MMKNLFSVILIAGAMIVFSGCAAVCDVIFPDGGGRGGEGGRAAPSGGSDSHGGGHHH